MQVMTCSVQCKEGQPRMTNQNILYTDVLVLGGPMLLICQRLGNQCKDYEFTKNLQMALSYLKYLLAKFPYYYFYYRYCDFLSLTDTNLVLQKFMTIVW